MKGFIAIVSADDIPEPLSITGAYEPSNATSFHNESYTVISTNCTDLMAALLCPSRLLDVDVTWTGPIAYTDIDNEHRTVPWSIGANEID